MKHFHKNSKLADIILHNYHLLPILHRFDIRLGFGDKTVEKICLHKGIDPDFFIMIINTFHDEDYFPEKELKKISPELIINYLQKTHRYYLEHIIPSIDKKLQKILHTTETKSKDAAIIERFYSGYKEELLVHIKDEEQNVFPQILRLQNQQSENKDKQYKEIKFQANFEQIHSDVDDKLLDLKNIIIKYLAPTYNDNDCNDFLYALFDFEKDLANHARIEDKILIPIAQSLTK